MKILFITSQGQDNLEDACLHGFRALFGADCVDFPKKEVMYANYAARAADACYGRLFTLWRTLENLPVDRMDIIARLRAGEFDLVVFGSIHRTQEYFQYYEPYLDRRKTILLDGEDDPAILTAARRFLYFKREILGWGAWWKYRRGQRVRVWRYGRRVPHSAVEPLAFSIPREKITGGVTRADKSQLLATHIIDDEVKNHPRLINHTRKLNSQPTATDTVETMLDEASTLAAQRGYLLNTESDYYRDLQAARFGITGKRGGWDCLRHYEIAANGAVQCFRALETKPPLCPPYNLNSGNCLAYADAEDLWRQIDALTDYDYDRLLENSYRWIAQQTTETRAREILATVSAKLG